MLENKAMLDRNRKNLSDLRTRYNDLGAVVSDLKRNGKELYQDYFNWATTQRPESNSLTADVLKFQKTESTKVYYTHTQIH